MNPCTFLVNRFTILFGVFIAHLELHISRHCLLTLYQIFFNSTFVVEIPLHTKTFPFLRIFGSGLFFLGYEHPTFYGKARIHGG